MNFFVIKVLRFAQDKLRRGIFLMDHEKIRFLPTVEMTYPAFCETNNCQAYMFESIY